MFKGETGIGTSVRLKKKHPCGGNEFVVERLGSEIMLRCTSCNARIELPDDRFIRNLRLPDKKQN